MGQQYQKSLQVCATCAYWAGDRIYQRSIQRAEVGSSMDRGRCEHKKGSWKNQLMQASKSCTSWEKWASIK